MQTSKLFSLLIAAAGLAIAQPTITYVENSASNIPPGLPSSAIAQGSLFVIKGANLGGATYVVAQTFPLQLSIAGSSVSISVGGKTLAGIMYYAGPAQVAAVLPSATPLGTGTVTVTYNNVTSAPAPITVVQNNLGIFTVSQSGAGDAIVTLGNGFASPGNAAEPGDTVAFWGTGLGPVNFDETNAAQQFDMTNVPVQAWVGGKQANVVFRGRNACCTAVDVVYIVIPAGVSGCSVPVVFQINNLVSNTVSIAVGSTRTCTPTNPAYSGTNIGQIIAQGHYSGGAITLSRTVTVTQGISVGGITVPGSTSRADSGSASFYKVGVLPGALGLAAAFDIASYGACSVQYYGFSQNAPPPVVFTYTPLDAGPSIAIGGPNGNKALAKSTTTDPVTNKIVSIGYYGSFDATGTYLASGNYTATGTGGPDVGTINAALTVPAPLTWTDMPTTTTNLTIDRSQAFTVHWTGGDPNGYVLISGASTALLSTSSGVAAIFVCTAKTSDGSFAIPPVVMLGIPPSGSITSSGVTVPVPGTLSVSGDAKPTTFTATGLDGGYFTSSYVNSAQVTYK